MKDANHGTSRNTTIPLYIVTGFLGSGKTTLLKRMLETYADSTRIAVIQNEFADGHIDGRELRETGRPFKILELNRGSVFCVCLLSDFVSSCVALVEEIKPNLVVLEASGLADPIAIVEILSNSKLGSLLHLGYIWSILDPSNFLSVHRNITRVVHQIRVADEVVLNKTDLTDRETIDATAESVAELNPYARIVETSYCAAEVTLRSADIPTAVRRADEHSSLKPGKRPPVGSATIRTHETITKERLMRFLSDYSPKCYRLKGYVNLSDGTRLSVQASSGQIQTTEVLNHTQPTELVAIGPEVEQAELESALKP